MKEKLEQIGIIKNSVIQLGIPKNTFFNFLKEITGGTEEIEIPGEPIYPYYGTIGQTNFEITEQQGPLGITSCIKLIGKINETEDGLELEMESHFMAQREYIFAGVGILMLFSGIVKISLDPSGNVETLVIALFGLFFILFTYAYMRRDANLAIRNFEIRIKHIKKRHNKRVKNALKRFLY